MFENELVPAPKSDLIKVIWPDGQGVWRLSRDPTWGVI
jgi:hypothetical protein